MLSARPVALGTDSHAFPSKTPARARGRVENAVPMTVHGKGKEIMIQTPFPAGKQVPQKAPMTTQVHGKQIVLVTRPRVLGDKTPFPNRSKAQQFQTPLQKASKFPVLSFLEPQTHLEPHKTPESQRRPSSTRKQDRVSRSAEKAFVTPLNNGNHWDVSDLSIVVPEAELAEELLQDDYDELEYMPPNTLHLPFEPVVDIELPDYKEVGKALFNFTHTCLHDESPVAEIEIQNKDIQLPGWDMIHLKELESDDPFHQRAMKLTGSRSQLKPAPLGRAAISAPKQPTVASKTQPPASLRPTPLPSTSMRTKVKDASSSRITQPVSRTMPNKATAPTVSGKPASVPLKPQVTNKVSSRPPTALRTAKPATEKPISRPATSAAIARTRSRAPSSVATTGTAARRPATVASQYKPLPTSMSRLGMGNRTTVVSSASTKKMGDGANAMDVIPFVDAPGDVLDDFNFDV
ncbi:hypothetical protein H0H92_006396 [Tricholoma furcatifolium]|nr:hypothetical protein H0H92_006396 [Tricholoma furcatifolium]